MFKRSFVRRDNGVFKGFLPYLDRVDVLPMTYTSTEAYIKSPFVPYHEREIEVSFDSWNPLKAQAFNLISFWAGSLLIERQ